MVDNLSPRELQIISRLGGPDTAVDLAEAFFVSVPTMKWHLRNIYRKLGVSSRADAVSVALLRGLLEPPAPFERAPDKSDDAPGSALGPRTDRTIEPW